jgi:hypothetical protein
MVPEVALMVTWEAPVGVDGTKTSLWLVQPTKKPAERMRAPRRPRRGKERFRLDDRRKGKMSIAEKGRKKPIVILAWEPMIKGRRSAVFFTVAMVTVLVAGAPEVTVNDAGEKVQVAASGRVLHARATVPLKLLVGTALTTAVTDDPSVTVRLEADALKP